MGYGPQLANSHEGYPVYLYTDPHSQMTTYAVVLPDGRAFYSDAHRRIVATPAARTTALRPIAFGRRAAFVVRVFSAP
jgi:hypothetical protein